MDIVANNWAFVLILALFVGMHLVRLEGSHTNGGSSPSRRQSVREIPAAGYSGHEAAARTMETGASSGARHAMIQKGDRE
jgi:hypothetical protein